MPKTKVKSHSGAKKRFRKTGKGKVKFWAAGKRHILTKKSAKRKRRARGSHVLSRIGDAARITRLLPYV